MKMTRSSDSRQASSIRCADQHPDFYALAIVGSMHETENKARLALGSVSRVAVERTCVEAFRCKHQSSLKLLLLSKDPGF